MTAFIAPSRNRSQVEEVADFGIRWFTVEREIPICGHATLASAQAVLTHSPPLVSPSVTRLRFTSPKGRVIVARRVEEGRLEISFRHAQRVLPVEGERLKAIGDILRQALPADVNILFIGRSQNPELGEFVLIEIDAPDLSALKVNIEALVRQCICPTALNIL